MPQLGARKQKQHSPEAKPLPPPAMDNIPLACQGHSQGTLASTLTQVSADANRQFRDKKSSHQTLQRQEEAGPGGKGQLGRGFKNRPGTERVQCHLPSLQSQGCVWERRKDSV